MHTQFQEIIRKFLKSATPISRDERKSSHETSPGQVISIQQTLISYDNHLNLYYSLINYLDSESLLLSKNLESGQTTAAEDINRISEKINELSKQTDLLLALIDQLNLEFSSLIADREFLNIQSPKFSDFEHFTGSTEFHVFFLNDDYTSEFTNTPRYKRLKLNKDDFEKLELIYQAARDPKDFLYKIHQSLNLEAHKKIALCHYEPRHNGFLVYFDPSLQEVTAIFEKLSKFSPNCLYRLNNGDSWIINTLEYNFETEELLKCFDAWIDTNWLTIYLQASLFPITKVSNPLSNHKLGHSCHHGSFLNGLEKGVLISKSSLLSTISKSNPYWYLQKVAIHDGNDFIELEDEPLICQFDLMLINFFNGENEGFIAYYNPIHNELTLYTEAGRAEAELLIKTYLVGLAITQNKSGVVL